MEIQLYFTLLGVIIVVIVVMCTDSTPMMGAVGLYKGDNYFIVYQDGYKCSYNAHYYFYGNSEPETKHNITFKEVTHLYHHLINSGFQVMELSDPRILYENYKLYSLEI
jgi:hypothetical protein